MCARAQTRRLESSTFAIPVLSASTRSTSGLERGTSPRAVCWFQDGSQSRRCRQVPNKSRPPPIRNHLLAALPREEYERLLPRLESVPLPFMGVLYEGGETIRHVYFPDDGLISLLIVMGDETVREIGVVGNEGMLGTAVALGMNATTTRALVQLPGVAMRMNSGALTDELGRGGALPDVLRRYSHALFTQVSQSAACVSTHAVDKRLSRWLL